MKKKPLMLFWAGTMLFSATANFAHPVTPTLIVERGLDNSMFGVALAAAMFVMFLLSPFWGKLCDYISTRRIMLICGFGYAIGQAIFGAAQSEIMVVGGRMFAGIFTGGLFVAFSNYIINVSEQSKRGQNLTTLVTIQTVCSALGYFVGGMLGLISVEATFTAQVILLALSGIYFYTVCEEDIAYRAKPAKPLSLREANPFSAFAAARSFMTPMLALIFISVAIAGIGYNSFEQCINYYIKDQFHLSSAYNGTIKAVIAGAILLANSSVCNYLQKKTDGNITFLPVILLNAAVLGVSLLVDALAPMLTVYVLFSVLNAIRLPMVQTLVANRASAENSNVVMGFYQSMNSLGNVFGALFAGLIYDAGPKLPFVLAFATFTAATLVSMVYVARYKKEKALATH